MGLRNYAALKMHYRNRRRSRPYSAIPHKDPQDEIARLESRLEELRMARPDFEAFNKAVLVNESAIETALQDCIVARKKRGLLLGLFTADKEVQQFHLIREKNLQRLADWEKQLVQKWPKAHSDIRQHPDHRWNGYSEQHWSCYVGWGPGKHQGLKFLLYDIDGDILHCEARITEIKQHGEAAARAAENKRLRKERQETKKARIEAVLNEARSNAQRIALLLPRNHPCPYCGGALGNLPHADHIHPVAKGGHSTKRNMVYVCRECNALK
jgi:hypothetical protein